MVKKKVALSTTLFFLSIFGNIGYSNYENSNLVNNCNKEKSAYCDNLFVYKYMPDNLFINKTIIFTKEELDNLYNQI